MSGGSYGIDAASHNAALAVGGSTIAWVPGGADRVIPSGHAQLLADVAASAAGSTSDSHRRRTPRPDEISSPAKPLEVTS